MLAAVDPPDSVVHPTEGSSNDASASWPHWRRPGAYTDPGVTQAKYDRELALFKATAERYRRDGVLLVREAYPALTFAFSAPHVRPRPVVFGVEIDFVNYDALPLSVRFVDPFSGAPMLGRDLPVRPDAGGMWGCQRVVATAEERAQDGAEYRIPLSSLFQGNADEPPFFCIPGTREYHQNPFHTGDSWFLHRGTGVGTLQHLLDQLVIHGTAPLRGLLPAYNIQGAGASIHIQMTGLQLAVDPNALPIQ